jgi:hypothetical protein
VRQKGFTLLIVVLVAIVLAIVGYFGYKHFISNLRTASFFLPLPVATPNIPVDWKTYSNSTYNYSFMYPRDWKVTEWAAGPAKNATVNSHDIALKSPEVSNWANSPGTMVIEETLRDLTSLKYTDLADPDWIKIQQKLLKLDGKQITLGVQGYDNNRGIESYTGVILAERFIIKHPYKNINLLVELDDNEQKNYEMTFSQILSTFKFTQ